MEALNWLSENRLARIEEEILEVGKGVAKNMADGVASYSKAAIGILLMPGKNIPPPPPPGGPPGFMTW